MTAIKPPDGRSPVSPLGPAAGRELEGVEKTGGPAFRDLLEGARPVGAAGGAGAAAGVAGADPVGALAQAVRSGAMTPQQAVDQLVERAVAAVGRSLSEPQRAELAALMHEALQNDPALRELRDAIG
jgi:hypothetical protein